MTRHVKEPTIEDGPFRMLGTILEANPYLGRVVTGRISSGAVKPNQIVKVLDRTGRLIEEGRLTKVLAFRGLDRTGVEEASAGDIVAIDGTARGNRVAHDLRTGGDTAAPGAAHRSSDPGDDLSHQRFALAETEGDKVQSRVIRERLLREAEGNVALKISESTEKDSPWRSPAAANCSSAS